MGLSAARTLSYGIVTHSGSVRTANQDAFFVNGLVGQSSFMQRSGVVHLGPGESWAAGVVDGMGGYAGGEIASLLSAQGLATVLTTVHVDDAPRTFTEAYAEATRSVRELARDAERISRLGATAAAVVCGDGCVVVSNVGDARVYKSWHGYLAQLSVDDRLSPATSAVTQSLGAHQPPVVDVHHLSTDFEDGAVLVLCSDGLSDVVDDEVIRDAIDDDPAATAARLLEAALRGGAPDNVTVVVVTSVRPSEESAT